MLHENINVFYVFLICIIKHFADAVFFFHNHVQTILYRLISILWIRLNIILQNFHHNLNTCFNNIHFPTTLVRCVASSAHSHTHIVWFLVQTFLLLVKPTCSFCFILQTHNTTVCNVISIVLSVTMQ